MSKKKFSVWFFLIILLCLLRQVTDPYALAHSPSTISYTPSEVATRTPTPTDTLVHRCCAGLQLSEELSVVYRLGKKQSEKRDLYLLNSLSHREEQNF